MVKNEVQETLTQDAPVKAEISSEKLTKELEEQVLVAKEILERQETERVKSLLTNPSAPALTTAGPEVGSRVAKVKKNIENLFILYLTNQFVARAINVRADTLISKGYSIKGEDDAGVKACIDLVDNSGGINLFWQLSVNTDIAGDGFIEKVYNQKNNKILRLRHVHPLTLKFKTDFATSKIIYDKKTKEPVGYVQKFIGNDGEEIEKDVPLSKIEHLRYNTLGDEFTGISTIQSGYNTIVRLMNMEHSAAEAAVKIASPIIVGKCNTKSPHQIAMWGQILNRINGRDQVFIPEGMELTTLQPGNQNFNDYADYFLDAVVSTFGTPKSVLLGSSDSSNRAETIVLTRHFYSLIRSLQRYQEDFFNKIFAEYGELAGFKPPKLYFEDIAEESSAKADEAIKLVEAGIISRDEARSMLGLYPTNPQDNIEDEVKKGDMDSWHPEEPGSPTGSQSGEKKKMVDSKFSTFRDGKKRDELK